MSSTRGHCGPSGNVVRVTVRADLPLDLDRLNRNFYTTSSCGVCGKASIEAVTASAGIRRVSSDLVVRESVLRVMPDTLRAAQAGFAETGGMHAVGLFTSEGELARHPRRRGPSQRHGQARGRRIDER